MGIVGLYKLFKSKSDEKGKDALVTLKDLANAAAAGAKVAKSAYDIIGQGLPMAVVYAVPGLSIAVSAINLLIRLWDAFSAGSTKTEMIGQADPLRIGVATNLGEQAPTEETVETSKVFDKDRRGTFPAYKTYYRTKQAVRDAIKQIVTTATQRSKDLGNNPRTGRQDRSVAHRAHKAVKGAIDATGLDGTLKNKLKTMTGNPNTVQEFKTQTVTPLAALDEKIDTYEYVDKMSEINQKRQVSGWMDVILEMLSIAGDIVTIATSASGIGAAVGQGIKAAAAGYKLVHGGAKFAQKLYRNRGDGQGKKSTSTKHKEYVGHARFIYNQIASLQRGDNAKAQQIEQYIRATGVNYGLWIATSANPQEQVEMLVEAMKQR